jgi:hypothetical protein
MFSLVDIFLNFEVDIIILKYMMNHECQHANFIIIMYLYKFMSNFMPNFMA